MFSNSRLDLQINDTKMQFWIHLGMHENPAICIFDITLNEQ